MCMGGSCDGAKRLPWRAECRCSIGFRDPRDVEIVRVIKHIANMWRRMREILQEQYEPIWERRNWGAAVSEQQPGCNRMSSSKMIETLLNVVATFHLANETWIVVINVFTARRHSPTSAHTSLILVATTMKRMYMYQPKNCQMMVLWQRTIVFYFSSFMNLIATLSFTLPTMIPVIQKPTGRMRVSIQSNLQFGHVWMELHTWTTV